jgi:hypothetical protein
MLCTPRSGGSLKVLAVSTSEVLMCSMALHVLYQIVRPFLAICYSFFWSWTPFCSWFLVPQLLLPAWHAVSWFLFAASARSLPVAALIRCNELFWSYSLKGCCALSSGSLCSQLPSSTG